MNGYNNILIAKIFVCILIVCINLFILYIYIYIYMIKTLKILNLNINFGTSIILIYYYIFEYLIVNKIVDKIIVSIDYNVLVHYRGNNDILYNNYIIFLKKLNTYENIIIEDKYNNSYNNICFTKLSIDYNIPIKFKIYDNLLNNNLDIDYDYITISTKILGIKNSLYQEFKNDLIYKLNNINIKIIILGEREISDCKEYKIHETYTIYNDLVNNLKNYVDLTINNNSNNNDLIPLLNTFNIYNKSKLNIFIGNGGVSELVSFFSNNILGFTYKCNLLDINNYLHTNTSNIKIYNNHIDFLNKLVIDNC